MNNFQNLTIPQIKPTNTFPQPIKFATHLYLFLNKQIYINPLKAFKIIIF